MWGNWVSHFIDTAKKPITELRNPIWDWGWTMMAYFSHFALGYQLGFLLAILILIFARFRGVKRVTDNDPWPINDGVSLFKKVQRKIERFCLGSSVSGNAFSFILRVAFFSAVIANLIDADHIVMFYGGPDRILHWPVLAISALIVLWCGSRIVKSKDEFSVRLHIFWFCPAVSLVAHVVEDYTFNLF